MSKVLAQLSALDIMSPDPVCAEGTTTIRSLARLFEENDISGCPVTDSEGRTIGVVSKSDLIRRCLEGTTEYPPALLFEVLLEQGENDEDTPSPDPFVCVEDCFTAGAVTVLPSTPVHEVAARMVEHHIHRVVVVDREEFPVGIITALDILRVFPRSGS